MCGIFGALAVDKDAQLNIAVLEELAVINEERGHHAFGFASTDNRVVKSFKDAGRPSVLKAKIAEMILPRATAFVGHTRWATHGDPEDNKNNHPHNVRKMGAPKEREGVIVHNGVVSRHEKLVERYDLQLNSICDSEVIARLFSCSKLFEKTGSGRISTLKRAKLTAEAMDCPSAFLFMSATRYAAVRMDRPLWWHKYEGVVYFSSIPLDFDSEYARGSITDNAVRTYNWSPDAGRWKLVGKDRIQRGLRGKDGARQSVSEMARDWRTSHRPQRASRQYESGQSLTSVRDSVSRLVAEGKKRPDWKSVADEIRAAKLAEANSYPADNRPAKCRSGKQITYTAGTAEHSKTCECSKCTKRRGKK